MITINDLVIPGPGFVDVKARVTKVNGLELSVADKGLSDQAMCVPNGWDVAPAMVIEEFTGTWCGFCPRGIVAMEKISKQYTDGSVIPIAIHASTQGATDPMQPSSYMPIVQTYAAGFPSAILNRRTFVELSNNISNIAQYHREYESSKALADLKLEAELSGERSFDITVTSKFAFNLENGEDFALALVVTEDNVGPYNQTNYYANNQYGAMDGWEKKSSPVSTVFNEVARQIVTATGVAGSIPAQIQANKEYTYNRTISLGRTIKIDDCNIIALLINQKTGVIETGTILTSSQRSAIPDVVVPTDDVVVESGEGTILVSGFEGNGSIYTPAGVCVATFKGESTINVPAGLYIVAAGNKSVKIVVR